MDTREYSQGLRAPGKVTDLTDVDFPPSLDHKEEQLNKEFEIESGVVMRLEDRKWA